MNLEPAQGQNLDSLNFYASKRAHLTSYLIEFGAPEARKLDESRTCLRAEPRFPKFLRFKTGAPHIL
jgi:hypothetical protein